jgi:hypothetical protein
MLPDGIYPGFLHWESCSVVKLATSGFAADPVLIPVKPLRVRLQNCEPSMGDASVVQIGWRRRYGYEGSHTGGFGSAHPLHSRRQPSKPIGDRVNLSHASPSVNSLNSRGSREPFRSPIPHTYVPSQPHIFPVMGGDGCDMCRPY